MSPKFDLNSLFVVGHGAVCPMVCVLFSIVLVSRALSNGSHDLSASRDFHNSTEDLVTDQHSTKGHDDHSTFRKLIDDETYFLLMILLYCGLCGVLSVCGIVTNVINIMVFIKQGFEDSINISLFGLAISDLGSLISLVCLTVWYSPGVRSSKFPLIAEDVSYLTAGWPRIMFTRITGWITAFITFERCLCITMPLKVKMIITPKRTGIIIAVIYLLLAGSVMPGYYTSRLEWIFSPDTNTTVLGLTFTQDRWMVDSVALIVCSTILPMLSFVIVVICTVILAINLNSKAKWREQSVKRTKDVSNKDKKVITMVSFISTVFIICFMPNLLVFFTVALEPEFSIHGEYKNLIYVIGACIFAFESVNSGINFFFYMKMSSKFRTTFVEMFYNARTTEP